MKSPHIAVARLPRRMLLIANNLGVLPKHFFPRGAGRDYEPSPCLNLLAGGGFKHGRHLAFNRDNNAPLCNLFVSMMQRQGLETDNFASSTGRVSGLEMA